MITHAFVKALLFLGAGSVIHGLHDEQDMRRMGALRKFMPVTAATFIVGWLAIAGVFPFSGFWSKDEILMFAWQKSPALWGVGLVTALLTAFYMSRQVFMVFFGSPRWDEADEHATADDEAAAETGGEQEGVAHAGAGGHGRQPHESPWTMLLPLVVLAVLATVGGVINLPFGHDTAFLERWLTPVLEEFETVKEVTDATQIVLALVALATALLGIAVAAAVYLAKRLRPVEPEVLRRAWYVDEALSAFMGGPGRELAEGAATVDRVGIDGAVNGIAAAVQGGGSRLRVVQSGYVRNYALGMALGALLLVGFFITRAGI
jgi:NADH-quinone oxidoreductase subunit L